MKRPLAVIGFSYSAALLAAFLFGIVHLAGAAVIIAALFVISLFLPKIRKLPYIKAVILSCAAGLMTLYFFNIVNVEDTDVLMENEVHIKAVICDLPYVQGNRVYYTLETSDIDFPDCPQHIKIRVSSAKALRAEPYDITELTVRFYSRSGSDRFSDIAKGIYLRGSIKEFEKITITKQDEKPLYYYALQARKRIFDIIDNTFSSSTAPFMKALLVGDKSALSFEDREVFRNAGITHILVASGFHLSVLTWLISSLLMLLFRCRKNTAAIFCAVFVFAYMAVVGFTPSIMRAGIMMIISLLGLFAFRQADPINSLGAAVLLICFINPYAVCDTGFLLSVTASLGILVLGDRLTKKVYEVLCPLGNSDKSIKAEVFFDDHKRGIKTIISAVTIPVSALVFTYPVTIVCFRFFAPYSILSNLPISFAASLLLVFLFLLVLCDMSLIFGFLKTALVPLCSMLSKYILWTAESISSLPYAGTRASYEYVPVMLAMTFSVTAVYYFAKKDRKRNTITVMFISALVFFTAGSMYDTMTKFDSKKVSVLDTGSGISVILSKNNDSAILSCGGSYDKIAEISSYLSDSSTDEIRYLLISDKSSDCSAYAENLMKNYHVRTVQVYDEKKCTDRMHSLIYESDEVILSETNKQQTESFICCGTEIDVYKAVRCNAVRFEVNGTVYLICHKGSDCSRLPLTFREVDIMITDGISENMSYVKAGKIILSDTPTSLEDDVKGMEADKTKLYYTAGYGNIGIRHYQDGHVSIRRENEWLN